MDKIAILIIPLAFSIQLCAGEVEDYCKLTSVQAAAKSSALAWPNLFVGLGNPYLTTNQTIIGGISQSLSGFLQALVTNDVSYHQCRFYTADKLVRDNVLNFENKIILLQAEAQRPILEGALKLAQANVDVEKRLFDSQNSTLADLSAAFATRDNIQSSLLAQEQKYNALQEIPSLKPDLNLWEQVSNSRAYQAKAASLTSLLSTLSAWDVVGAGGVRTDLQAGTTGGFWSINLTFNLGVIPSGINTSNVDSLTRRYIDGQHDSPQNMYLRLMRSLKDALLSERNNRTYILDRIHSIQELLKRAKTADSISAKRMQRNLAIQESTQKAALEASTIKIQEIEKWLSANAE